MKGLRRSSGALVAMVVLAAVATGCVQEPARITASAGLFPTFSRDITDYVNRCDPGVATKIDVDATAGTTVSVNGSPLQGGQFSVSVPQQVGRRFVIAVRKDDRTTTHSVRCLPPDFPRWEVTRTRATQAEYYATLPFDFANFAGGYPTLFDDHGVPIWWGEKSNGRYATMVGNNPTWFQSGVFEEHRLDGSLVRTFGTVGAQADFHDLVVLPNGNHVMATVQPRAHANLSSWGGPSDTTILDHVIQEIDPLGRVVWSWDTADHISVNETTPYFRLTELQNPGGPFSNYYDPFHYNSVTPSGNGYVLSFRHLDAVYKIDRATGNIEWKLGGSLRVESLGFFGDYISERHGAFGGQHDARVLSDGTVTLYDDGTGKDRAPRAVAYRLELDRRRAVLLDQVTDPSVPRSDCCGSARVTPRGNYVLGWGGTVDDAPDITESTPSGTRIFSIRFPNDVVYRAEPIPFNTIPREDLRRGMDARYAARP